MESSKEKILREFDKEIDEGFLRGASSAEQLVGIKRFISHTLDDRKAKLKEKALGVTRRSYSKEEIELGWNTCESNTIHFVIQLIEEVL